MTPIAPTLSRLSSLLVAGVALVTGGTTRGTLEAQPPGCTASTSVGDVQGERRDAACAYLGIPYAAPPLGPRRWRPPQPPVPWSPAVLQATTLRQCPQLSAAGAPLGNEDCLWLNVWTPADARPGAGLPVLVWLHPGAFQAASSNLPAQDGQRFASTRSAIVVIPNYRLGALGFLSHRALAAEDPMHPASGNYGLADQRAALAWVRQNIEGFGGHPGNVTLAGTSAGGDSTSLHLVSPLSRGLFQRAIIQSGSATTRRASASEAEQQGDRFAAALGCRDDATVLTCLRAASRDQVLQALPIGQAQVVEDARTDWGPVVDGIEVPGQPRDLFRRGLFSRVPTIIGVQRDEGWTFVDRSFPSGLTALQYEQVVRSEFVMDAAAVLSVYPLSMFRTPMDALAQLAGDVEFVCEARRIARVLHHDGARVYAYSFDHPVTGVTAGRVAHGLEPNFVFGNPFAVAPNLGITQPRPLTPVDLIVSDAMGTYWRRFMETGDPNPRAARVEWPPYRALQGEEPVDPTRSDFYFSFGEHPKYATALRDPACNFWEPFFLRSVLGSVPAAAR